MSDELSAFLEELPDEPCTESSATLSTEEQKKIVAKLFVEHVLSGELLTYEQIRVAFGHKTTNHIGTLTGKGQNGNGMQLWKSHATKGIKLCQENARIVLQLLTGDEIKKIVSEHDLTLGDFFDKVRELPSAA